MRILIVSPLPYPLIAGGQVGTFQMIRGLSKRHQITILSPTEDEKSVAELRKLLPNVEIITYASSPIKVHSKDGHLNKMIQERTKAWARFQRVKGLFSSSEFTYRQPEDLKQHILNIIHARQIDILQVNFPWMMGVVNYVPPSIPSVFGEYEIPFIVASRYFQYAENVFEKCQWLKKQYYYKKQEIMLGRKYHAIITLTEVDKRILQRVLPHKPIFVSPLGTDTFYYRPTGENYICRKITFMGNWRHPPNVDGLRFFFKQIFPIIKEEMPDIMMFILGDFDGIDKGALSRDPSVVWTGFVEDTRSYLEGSVFVVPLRIGSGIRIKILEAMSMGCPVVSTSVGCEGIPARHGKDIFIENNPSNFARRISYLIENQKQAMEVGQNARKMIVREYDLEKVVERREKVYQEILHGKFSFNNMKKIRR